MRWFLSLWILVTSTIVYADNKLIVDRYISPFAGSTYLTTAQELAIVAEDSLLQGRVSENNSIIKISGRALEQVFLWNTFNSLLDVTQHEVFGHGYRLRQLHNPPFQYHITPLGGSTSFNIPNSFKVGYLTAVTVAGLESEAIMARDIKFRWMQKGLIDGRAAGMYTQAQQSLFVYTLITKLGKIDDNQFSGNDVASYRNLLNATYRNDKMTIKKLMNYALFNLIDPMTFYSYYAYFYYIGTGKPSSIPMIHFSDDLKYLPNIRIGYAPYAPEAYVENFFIYRDNPYYFYLKGGKRSFGVGATLDKLWCYPRATLGLRFDFWNQQNFISSATVEELRITGNAFRPSLNKRTWGGALSLVGNYNLMSKLGLYVEVGAKSKGYLPGYSLGKDLVFRIGLTQSLID